MKIQFPKYFKKSDAYVSAIYFVVRRGKVVYIGKSESLFNRLFLNHPYIKDSDLIRFIPCAPSRLLHYERRWVIKFRPKYNNVHLFSRRGSYTSGKRYRVAINLPTKKAA